MGRQFPCRFNQLGGTGHLVPAHGHLGCHQRSRDQARGQFLRFQRIFAHQVSVAQPGFLGQRSEDYRPLAFAGFPIDQLMTDIQRQRIKRTLPVAVGALVFKQRHTGPFSPGAGFQCLLGKTARGHRITALAGFGKQPMQAQQPRFIRRQHIGKCFLCRRRIARQNRRLGNQQFGHRFFGQIFLAFPRLARCQRGITAMHGQHPVRNGIPPAFAPAPGEKSPQQGRKSNHCPQHAPQQIQRKNAQGDHQHRRHQAGFDQITLPLQRDFTGSIRQPGKPGGNQKDNGKKKQHPDHCDVSPAPVSRSASTSPSTSVKKAGS